MIGSWLAFSCFPAFFTHDSDLSGSAARNNGAGSAGNSFRIGSAGVITGLSAPMVASDQPLQLWNTNTGVLLSQCLPNSPITLPITFGSNRNNFYSCVLPSPISVSASAQVTVAFAPGAFFASFASSVPASMAIGQTRNGITLVQSVGVASVTEMPATPSFFNFAGQSRTHTHTHTCG